MIQKEIPAMGELVLIKINKILPHGAYCELTEYRMEAYLPISEIAPGWIKNIHEFIKEGQKDVAKVIAVDREKRSVDISLKKATSKEKSKKLEEYNLDRRGERLFNQAIAEAHLEDRREAIVQELSKRIPTYSELINAVAENREAIGFLNNKPFEEKLVEIVSKNVKPKRYIVSYTLELRSLEPNDGVTLIRRLLEEIASKGVGVLYLGAPRYRLTSEDSSYPKAESRIKETQRLLDRYSKQLSFSIKSEKM